MKTNYVCNNGKASVFIMGLIAMCTVLLLPMESFGFYDPPVTVGLGLTKPPKPGEPLVLGFRVVSKMPLKDPKVMVKVPVIGSLPAQEVVVWDGSPEVTYPHKFEYTIPDLLPGRYVFEAILEFTAPDEAKIQGRIGKHTVVHVNKDLKEKTYQMDSNIYLDVRPHRIYAGPSFEDIEKVELINSIRLKTGKGQKDLPYEELIRKPLRELEEMNGGPWKDKLDHSDLHTGK